MTTVLWSEIIGLRNRLIHGYDSVDLDIVTCSMHDLVITDERGICAWCAPRVLM